MFVKLQEVGRNEILLFCLAPHKSRPLWNLVMCVCAAIWPIYVE